MRLQDQVKPLLIKYGVKRAAFFGSIVRGDFDEDSDVDILIEPPRGMGIKFIALKHELEDLLQKKVDLASYNGLDKYLKPHILKHQQPIL